MSENTELENSESQTALERVVYELGYHVLSTVGEERLKEEVQKIKDALEKHHAILIAEEVPTIFRLAYTIIRGVGGKREKYDTSYFGWVKFDLPIGEVVKLKDELEKNENILRFLVIKTVREDTRAPHMPNPSKDEEKTLREKHLAQSPQVKKDPVATVSEAELNRTIEELVVE